MSRLHRQENSLIEFICGKSNNFKQLVARLNARVNFAFNIIES